MVGRPKTNGATKLINKQSLSGNTGKDFFFVAIFSCLPWASEVGLEPATSLYDLRYGMFLSNHFKDFSNSTRE